MMEGIRIIELPKCKMVSSGYADDGNPFKEEGKLMTFSRWWSALDEKRTDKFFPRDFMWFDREKKRFVWYYALPDSMTDTSGYDVVDFEGGLYAAHISKDGGESDGECVYAGIKEWVAQSICFELDERPGHYDVFHITTPKKAAELMGYSQLDIYVPIRPKQTVE